MSTPEGAFVTARIEVVQYLHPETGDVWWNIDHDESSTLTQLIGLLMIATLEMYARSQKEET